MENVTRRKFIQSATVVAAGAAIGVTAYKDFLWHGPVDLRVYLFSKEPIIVKATLFSDERKNTFGLHVIDEHGDAVAAEMPLSRIKEILASTGSRGSCPAIVHYRNGRTERMSVIVASESEKFTMRTASESTPAWLQMQDIRRVL